MMRALKRLLGQTDQGEGSGSVLVDYQNRPRIPQEAMNVAEHVPMDSRRTEVSLEKDLTLERIEPGESIAKAMTRIHGKFADAVILDSLILGKVTGGISFPLRWDNIQVYFPGTVFRGRGWTQFVSGLNLGNATTSIRVTRHLDEPLDQATRPAYLVCAVK